MMEKMRFYLISGIVGFVFTFILAIRNNPWGTSMSRALLAFAIWCLLAFLLKWVLVAIAGGNRPGSESQDAQDIHEEQRGAMLDVSTPDEDQALMDLIHPNSGGSGANGSQGGDAFVPLSPPKLVSTKDPEELAKAVRHLTEE